MQNLAQSLAACRANLGKKESAERIALVDAWLQQQQETLKNLAKIEREQVQAKGPVTSETAGVVTDPNMPKISAGFVEAISALSQEKLQPQERIRQVDQVLSQYRTEIQARNLALTALTKRHAGDPTITQTSNSASPLETRRVQLVNELHSLIAGINALSPEAHIAAVDAALPEIISRQREIYQIGHTERSNP